MVAETRKASRAKIGKRIAYVMDKKKGETLFLQNIPFAKTVDQVISQVELTASQSERCKKPLYHLIISWDPNDMSDEQRKTIKEMGGDIKKLEAETVTNEEMTLVAKRMLKDLGLEEHQAIVARHRDRPHPHMHILVNRVHPVTCTAWRGSKDYATIQRTLRSMERQFGWREVPGRHASLPGHEIPPRRATTKAGVYSNKKKGLPPPNEGQPAPDKFIMALTEDGQTLTMPSNLPQNARQLAGCWKRAVDGDAHCQWQMGEVFRLGAGVKQDLRIAMGWYELASAQGHAKATDVYDKLAQRGVEAIELPKKPAWGKGVDSDWRGRVGRDRREVGEGLEDRGLEHRLQR